MSPDPSIDRNPPRHSPGHRALFLVNLPALLLVLALARTFDLDPFPALFVWSTFFFLFLVPALAPRANRVAHSLTLVVLLAAGLCLLSLASGRPVQFLRPTVVLLSATTLGYAGSRSRDPGRYLAFVFLLSALPVVVWLAFLELCLLRSDWLLTVSPVAAVVFAVFPVTSAPVQTAATACLALLALVYLARTVLDAVHPHTRPLPLLLGVAGLVVLSGNVRAQTPPVARLELGQSGVLIAGAWNPARLSVEPLTEPVDAALVVDGAIEHRLRLVPGQPLSFLMFIPGEQPVFELRLFTSAGVVSSALSRTPFETVSPDFWPGLLIVGSDAPADLISSLEERAPGCKFLTVSLQRLKDLPPAYLEQFPIVMIRDVEPDSFTQADFVRLTEWLASRVLVLPPGSRVRQTWPGLRGLDFQRIRDYDVLNPGVMSLLHRPRLRIVDPHTDLFGESRPILRVQRRAMTLVVLLALTGTILYLVLFPRVRPTVSVASVVLVAVVFVLVGGAAVRSVRSRVYVSDLALREAAPDCPVGLSWEFTHVAGLPGLVTPLERGPSWIPVYSGEAQRQANLLRVDSGLRVELVRPPQLFRRVSTTLLTPSDFPSSEEVSRLLAGELSDVPWAEGSVVLALDGARGFLPGEPGNADPVGATELGVRLRRVSGGRLGESWLRWWMERVPADRRCLMRIRLGEPTTVDVLWIP